MKQLIDIINEKLILAKQKTKYPAEEYFYHEALEDGYIVTFGGLTKNILQYSIDNCNTWNELKPYKETPKINKGQYIYFKGENMEVNEKWGIGRFESNKNFNVGGNIMSLIYGNDFIGKTKLLEDHQFKWLFCTNSHLISANNLILPATELTDYCYDSMFRSCTSLIDTPELPATELTTGCYMFMFNGCISLKEAPELPATELWHKCYERMFWKCTNLTKAPELHATKLFVDCYSRMFVDCTSLNEITMLATDADIQLKYYLHDWVRNVSSTGTFIKAKGVDIPTGEDGIPEGWTVKEI